MNQIRLETALRYAFDHMWDDDGRIEQSFKIDKELWSRDKQNPEIPLGFCPTKELGSYWFEQVTKRKYMVTVHINKDKLPLQPAGRHVRLCGRHHRTMWVDTLDDESPFRQSHEENIIAEGFEPFAFNRYVDSLKNKIPAVFCI